MGVCDETWHGLRTLSAAIKLSTAAPRQRRSVAMTAQADACGSALGECSDQRRVVPKIVTPSAKRQVAEALVKDHRLPIRRPFQIAMLSWAGLLPNSPGLDRARSGR